MKAASRSLAPLLPPLSLIFLNARPPNQRDTAEAYEENNACLGQCREWPPTMED